LDAKPSESVCEVDEVEVAEEGDDGAASAHAWSSTGCTKICSARSLAPGVCASGTVPGSGCACGASGVPPR